MCKSCQLSKLQATSFLNKYWSKKAGRIMIRHFRSYYYRESLNEKHVERVWALLRELKTRHRVYRSLLVWLSDRPLHCSVPMEDNHRQSRVTMNSFPHSSISRRALQTHLFSQHKRSHLLWCHCQRLSFVSVALRNSTPFSFSFFVSTGRKEESKKRCAPVVNGEKEIFTWKAHLRCCRGSRILRWEAIKQILHF